MSLITWRWYKISGQGALLPFNDNQPHVPNEPVKAGCLNYDNDYDRSHYVHTASGRTVLGGHSFQPAISEQSFRDMVHRGEVVLVKSNNHDSPVMECTCGHYVFKWSEDALALPRHRGYEKLCKVFAAVEVWGRLIEHDLGYRAEYSLLRGVCSFGRKVHPVYEVDRARTVEELIERWEQPDDDPEDDGLSPELVERLKMQQKEVTNLYLPEGWAE